MVPTELQFLCFFFFNDTATTEIYTLPLHDALPISRAIDEALTNIVRHSYSNRLDQPIAMYFRRARRRHDGQVQQGLEILLCDRGPAVDPSKFQGRPLEEIRPGGLGLHFIRQAMDTVRSEEHTSELQSQ